MTEELETMSGRVSQVAQRDGKATGLKLEGREEEWLNFSQYPKGPMDKPNKGDSVKLGVSKTRGKDGEWRWWIGTCEIQYSDNGADPFAPSDRETGMRRGNALNVAGAVVAAFVAHGHYDNEEYPVDAAFIDVLAHAQDLERGEPKEIPFE